MSAPITGRERYEWLVPIGRLSTAHAFIPGGKHSICFKVARFEIGHLGWQREELLPGEPHRARCPQCLRILKRNPGMGEVPA